MEAAQSSLQSVGGSCGPMYSHLAGTLKVSQVPEGGSNF
jgi:hypothetical protein